MKIFIAVALLAPFAALAQNGYGGQVNAPQRDLSNSRLPAKEKQTTPATPDSATTAATPATAVTIAAEPAPGANPCVRPDLNVTIKKKEEGDAFNQKNATYRDCVQAYVNVQKTASDQHAAAANTTVQEFNAFSVELNEKFGKTKPQ